jgi:hypothetical protein
MKKGIIASSYLYWNSAQPTKRGPAHLGHLARGQNKGGQSPFPHQRFIGGFRPISGDSLDKMVSRRKPGWRGTRFGVMDGEGLSEAG